MMIKRIAILCALALAGCAHSTKPPADVPVIAAPKRPAPTHGMDPCDRPSPLADKSFGEVVRALADALADLQACEQRRGEWQHWYEDGH